MITRRGLLSMTMSCILCWLVAPSHALLQSVDWKSPGDGLITLDTDTGLAWLDLKDTACPLTNVCTYNTVLELLEPGGSLEGFRFPTEEEVKGLWAAAGVMETAGLVFGDAAQQNAIRDLLALIGVTHLQSTETWETSYGVFPTSASASDAVTLSILAWDSVVDYHAAVIHWRDDIGVGSSSGHHGFYLVREGYVAPERPVAYFKTLNVIELGYPQESTNEGAHMVGGIIRFDATESYDPDGGEIQTYEWTIDGGGEVLSDNGNKIDIVFKEARIYTITLVVVDDSGLKSEPYSESLDLSLREGDLILLRSGPPYSTAFDHLGLYWTHVGMYVPRYGS